jgi:outer membrane protein OmpA-like peptidoglycan-associated protein
LALSKRRAANVAQALAAAGLPEPLFDVEGLGASTARTAKGAPAMLQRKTLVVIQVASGPPVS